MLTRLCVVVIALASVSLVGCSGSKVNQTNFERLKVGMSLAQVEGILGKGAKDVPNDEVAALMKEATGLGEGKLPGIKTDAPDLSAAKGLRWGDDKKSVTVIFMNDRANRIFKKGF